MIIYKVIRRDNNIKKLYDKLPRGKKKVIITSLIGNKGNIYTRIKNFKRNICNKELVLSLLEQHNIDKNIYYNYYEDFCKDLKNSNKEKRIKEKDIIKNSHNDKSIIKKLEKLESELKELNKKLKLSTYKNIFIEYFKNIEKKLRKFFNFKSIDDVKKECKKEYETFKKNH